MEREIHIVVVYPYTDGREHWLIFADRAEAERWVASLAGLPDWQREYLGRGPITVRDERLDTFETAAALLRRWTSQREDI